MRHHGRAIAAGIASLVAVLLVYARLPQPPGGASAPQPDLDSNTIAILPFHPMSGDPALQDLRDWLQDLMAARLTVEGSFRVVSPDAIVEMRPRADGLPPVPLSPDASLRLAAQLGAGRVLDGAVSGTPRRLSVEARLLTVPHGAVVARTHATGSADSLPLLADHLAVRLLATAASSAGEDSLALAATSLPALRAHLAGRHAFRRGRLRDAMVHFERAVALDSTLGPPAVWLAAIGALYGTRGLDERWKFEAAWKHKDQLRPADRALLVAHLGPHYPAASTLAELIAAGELAAHEAPEWAEAWFIAGENLWRFGPLVGDPRWEARAVAALGRALALDSSHALTLDGLLLFAAGAGDREAVRRYDDLYFAHNSDAESAEFVRWRAAVALGDSATLAALRPRFDDLPTVVLQRIVLWSHEHGVGLGDGDRAADALLRRASGAEARRVATQRRVPLLLNRGRPREASRLLAAFEPGFAWQQGVGVLEFRIYAALFWDGDPSEAATAAQLLEAYLVGAAIRPGQVRDQHTAACALAHWRLNLGNHAGAEAVLARLRRLSTPREWPVTAGTRVCMAAVEAQLASLRGGPTSAVALQRLDSMLLAVSSARDQVVTVGNLVAARLYEARGDMRRALGIVRRRAWFNVFLSTQLREEARLATLLGDHAGAIRAYRHYLALRSDPEPALQPEVESARSELQRLERESSGS